MLEEKLCKIPQQVLSQYKRKALKKIYKHKGAYHLIGAYDIINHASGADTSSNKDTQFEYYTFGFSGLLSKESREDASYDLYKHIQDIYKLYKDDYHVSLNLVCYSHGGNVALHLPDIHKKYGSIYDHHININTIVLYGTPIQKETARNAQHIMFESVLNIYSEGDNIQTSDLISTKDRKSHHTLSHFIDTSSYNYICDARIMAEDDSYAFGHLNYWCLDKYYNYFSWTMSTKAQNVVAFLSPLPLVICTPAFIQLSRDIKHSHAINHIDISLKKDDHYVICHAYQHNTHKTLARSSNLYEHLQTIKEYTLKDWYPESSSSEFLKAGIGLWSAVQSLWN
jgi:hypothetical protein